MSWENQTISHHDSYITALVLRLLTPSAHRVQLPRRAISAKLKRVNTLTDLSLETAAMGRAICLSDAAPHPLNMISLIDPVGELNVLSDDK